MQPHFMSDGRMYWLVKTRPNLGRGFNTMTYINEACLRPRPPEGALFFLREAVSCFADARRIAENRQHAAAHSLDADGKKLIPHTLTDNRGERYICSSDVADVHAEDTCTTSAVTSFRFAYRWLMVFELAIPQAGSMEGFSGAWEDLTEAFL